LGAGGVSDGSAVPGGTGAPGGGGADPSGIGGGVAPSGTPALPASASKVGGTPPGFSSVGVPKVFAGGTPGLSLVTMPDAFSGAAGGAGRAFPPGLWVHPARENANSSAARTTTRKNDIFHLLSITVDRIFSDSLSFLTAFGQTRQIFDH
jgi:hypothetical protein